MNKLQNNLLRPSYKTGFAAPRRGLSYRYPSLWRDCTLAVCPSLGRTGVLWHNFASAQQGAVTCDTLSTFWTPHGCYFDGTDKVTFGEDFADPADLSFSFWLKIPSTGIPSNTSICSSSPALSDSRLYLHLNTLEQIGVFRGTYQYSSVIPSGKWVHFGYAVKSTAYVMYVDGKEDTSGTQSLTKTTQTGFLIGDGFASNLDNTYLDDFRIYKRALTAPEIRLLASRPRIAYEYDEPTVFAAVGGGGGGGGTDSTGVHRWRLVPKTE